MSKSKDFLSALNRIVDAFDGTTGGNNNDDMLTALDNIADAIENGSQGGGGSTGGVMVVHLNGNRLDKTWQEISDAMKSGMPVMVNSVVEDEDSLEVSNNWVNVAHDNGNNFSVITDSDTYVTSSSDGYPEYNDVG